MLLKTKAQVVIPIAAIAAVVASIDTAHAFVSRPSSSSFSSLSMSQTQKNIGKVHSLTARKMSRDEITNYANHVMEEENNNNDNNHHRRTFLLRSMLMTSSLLTTPRIAQAEEGEDLTSKLYNPDGSLRSTDTEVEAKSKIITTTFPSSSSDDVIVSFDGATPISTSSGNTLDETTTTNTVKISYAIPQKWTSQDNQLYLDTSEGINAQACNRITLYQSSGTFTPKTLSKATTNGVAKTLGISTNPNLKYNPTVSTADLISGRKSLKGDDDDEYYEFDLAVAPETCDTKGKDNLGLGFCPYDSILLASATVKRETGKMYVLTVECSKDQWKRSSSDLKRVRSSFIVE